LAAITTVDPAADVLPIVDISDTSMAASGTTKKITSNQILGAGGTATLASATITGDLTVATSVLKVDSANTRVGINTTTINGGPFNVKISSAIDAKFVVQDGFTTGNVRLAAVDNAYTAYKIMDYSALSHAWYNSGSTAMTLNSTGLGVGGSPDTGLFTVGSTGITSATTPSMRIVSNKATFVITSDGATNAAGTTINYSWANGGQGPLIFRNAAIANVMTLDSSGNVGVGVTPSATDSTYFQALEIARVGQGLTAAKNALTGSPSSWLSNNSYATYSSGVVWNYAISQPAAQYRLFEGQHQWFNAPSGTAGNAITFTQAMTLTANSNLLIGTTTDVSTVKMQVWSPDSNNIVYFRNSNATTPYGPSIRYTAATPNNTGSEFLYCEDSTALRASLRSNGGLANYQANNVSLSDSRLKTDIKPLASYWNKIKSLELVTFKYKDQTHSDDNIGLIAQQVESVAPELVDVDGFGETPADGVPLKTIYTTDLYHASIKALQEAMARIEALEAKLA
jgi:hypothetical protein